MKRCSTSLIIGEMQLKTRTRCHIKTVRWLLPKGQETQVLVRMWGKGNFVPDWWNCKCRY